MRINRYVALALGVSRRSADTLIESGKILLNGRPASVGARTQTGDEIRYQGTVLTPQRFRYVLFNKPTGYVCSRRAQGDLPTIYQLLPKDMQSLFVAGRLDADSSGLLVLSNDGEFCHTLMHPSHKKEKQYTVVLRTALSDTKADQIRRGVVLDDGPSALSLTGKDRQWTVKMHEGRNRQIRRTFQAVGATVVQLHRTKLGAYSLGKIAPGKYQDVEKITT